jgi:2-polyprenyl-6-methoxyphenol hydroxylase-like FAD-dependent oxidoreductase
MRDTDVTIVGAGLAGSLAATMLGRAGYSTALVDPFTSCRADFRCEKLEEAHVETLRSAGVADQVLRVALRYQDIWVARLGRLAEIKPIEEYGIEYSALVNTLRGLVPESVTFIQGKVIEIAPRAERQVVTLADGAQISSRLVVCANGLLPGMIGERRALSACHSISIGFDVEPPAGLPFDALTYFGESPESRVAYLTLFPLPAGLRANLFVYREMGDPWLRQMRDNPSAAIAACMPRLADITGRLRVHGSVKVRPVDLSVTENALQPGVVLVGDAFSTACPVSGTGAAKALLDVERLCNVHIPGWLASFGMGADKIAQFYADPVKRESDAHSYETSVSAKRATLGQGLMWTAFRWSYFAGSLARNFLNHGDLPEHPAKPDAAAVPAAAKARA